MGLENVAWHPLNTLLPVLSNIIQSLHLRRNGHKLQHPVYIPVRIQRGLQGLVWGRVVLLKLSLNTVSLALAEGNYICAFTAEGLEEEPCAWDFPKSSTTIFSCITNSEKTKKKKKIQYFWLQRSTNSWSDCMGKQSTAQRCDAELSPWKSIFSNNRTSWTIYISLIPQPTHSE